MLNSALDDAGGCPQIITIDKRLADSPNRGSSSRSVNDPPRHHAPTPLASALHKPSPDLSNSAQKRATNTFVLATKSCDVCFGIHGAIFLMYFGISYAILLKWTSRDRCLTVCFRDTAPEQKRDKEPANHR